MTNRLPRVLTRMGILLGVFAFTYQVASAQNFTFSYPGQDTFYLDINCEAVLDFGGMPPIVTSNIGATIVPPTGVDAAQTGFAFGETITSVQNPLTIVYQMADDMGNNETEMFDIYFLDNIGPQFADGTPPNITIDCVGDLPAPVSRFYVDNCDGTPTQISSIDDPNIPMNECGVSMTYYRVWEAVDNSGNITRDSQAITILADNQDPEIIDFPNDTTVTCENEDLANWVADQETKILATATDNCGNFTITNDAPPAMPSPCSSVPVTFVLFDGCMETDTAIATYTVLDTIAPILAGIPQDTTLSCDALVPMPPAVTATDNCDVALGPPILTEEDDQTADGTCTDVEYTLFRIWSITDACGNISVDTQRIHFIDTLGPTFTTPLDTTLLCNTNDYSPDFAGFVTNVTDNCGGLQDTTFTDVVTPGACPQEMTIERTWMVTDVCGNSTSSVQNIFVVDTVAPTFIPPALDTAYIECTDIGNTGLTGMPTDVLDNCDPSPTTTGSDEIFDVICLYSYSIRRTWYFEDACGNIDSTSQIIIVQDTVAPVLAMEAQDTLISCGSDADAEAAFLIWINNHGGGMAADNCSTNVVWNAYNSGTTDPAILPEADCMNPAPKVYRSQLVDFVAMDDCGNMTITTAEFTVQDDTEPEILACFQDTIVGTDPGLCTSTIELFPPLVIEECGTIDSAIMLSQTVAITSQALPGNEANVIVDPIVFEFAVPGLPASATSNVTLHIDLNAVDAESPSEFFSILGENGVVFGQTNPTPAQCDSSATTIVLSPGQFNSWAADGIVTITLVPNNPGPTGAFGINAICGGTVDAMLSYTSSSPNGFVFEYSLDFGTRIPVDPVMPFTETFDLGNTLVTYHVRDCAGNEVSCFFVVTVEDREPPVLTCPADIAVNVDADACEATVEVPVPVSVTDNCGATELFEQTQPSTPGDELITYTINPNTGGFVADGQSFIFTGVPQAAIGDVTLTIQLQGDIDELGEYFTIYGQGDSLGITEVGQPNVVPGDCNNVSTITFTIPAETLNSWAIGGIVTIVADSNTDFNPPFSANDGVNPCTPIGMNGQNDGTSFMTATLSFETVSTSYFATGATEIALDTITGALVPQEFVFGQGVTTFSYIVSDMAGNQDTCSFNIEVIDNIAPEALCLPNIVTVNPSGLMDEILDPLDIDNGSFDNCGGLDTMYVLPSTITCDMIGDVVNVDLVVIDPSGNMDVCQTVVSVTGEGPEPTFTAGACGSDTLFLFANPPGPSPNIWEYSWVGPQGFTSSLQNPFIPNATGINSGTYTLTISGFTDCEAVGTVQVSITDGPATPTLSIDDLTICENQNMVLSVPPVSGGGMISYIWLDGDGVPFDTTSTPTLVITPPFTPGEYCFTAMTVRNGCESGLSNEVCAMVIETPVAVTIDESIVVCEGDDVELGTFVEGPGITYEWTGPNNFFSTAQYPMVLEDINLLEAGLYELEVSLNGCPSAPDVTVVNVLDRPDQPIITNNTSMMNPACEGEPITLMTNIDDATGYEWSGGNGILFFVTDEPILVIDEGEIGLHDGQWTVTAVDNMCESEPAEVTTVYIGALPIVTASSNSPVCANANLVLTVNQTSGATYEWTGPGGTEYSGSTVTISNPVAGNYSVTVTSSSGCKTVDETNVVVNGFPVITSVSSNAIPCPAGPTDITLVANVTPATGTYSYLWTNTILGYSSNSPSPVLEDATPLDNGVYTLVVTNQFGCSSAPQSVDVNMGPILPVPPTPQLGAPNPYCDGDNILITTNDIFSGTEEIYHWITPNDGEIITTGPSLSLTNLEPASTGAYAVVAEIDGCFTDTSTVVMVQVNEIPEAVASSNSPVCQGDALVLFFEDCTPTPGTFYQWFGPTGSGVSSSNCSPVISPADPATHSGVYTAILTVDGCESEPVEVSVFVDSLPETPQANNNGPLCLDFPDESLTLSVDPGSTTPGAIYTWYYQGDPLGPGSGSTTFTIDDLSDLSPGANAFTVTALVNGCESEFSAETIVQLDTVPPNNADAGENFQICEGQVAELMASQPSIGTGLWTIAQGNPSGVDITNQNMAVTTVQGLIPGETYEFVWTLSNGACTNYSSDEVEILVDILEVAEAGVPFDTCAVTSVLLDAVQPAVGNGIWSQPPAQEALGVMISDINDPNSAVTGLVPGNEYIFFWTLPDNGCGESQDVVTVTIIDEFAFAGDNYFDCGDGCTTLGALRPDAGFGSWSSPDPNITFFNIDEPDAIACNLSPGPNTLVWTLNNGSCGLNGTDEVIVEYKYAPVAENDLVNLDFAAQANINVILNDFMPDDFFVELFLEPVHGTVIEVEDGTFLYQADVNYIGEDQFIYEVCSETCDCSQGTVFINIGEDARCVIPTIITPNGDGVNDLFVIPCLADVTSFPDNEVAIFNQWGDEVFRQKGYKNDWGGTFDGEDLPTGTYYFIVDFGDGSDIQTGFLVLQR